MQSVKNNSGFSLVASIILIGALSGVTYYLLNSNIEFIKNHSKIQNKFSVENFNSLIKSNLTYEISCQKAWISGLNLPSDFQTFVANSGGPIVLNLPDSITAKDQTNVDIYNLYINSLALRNFSFINSMYGLTIYSGKILIQSDMTKNSVKGYKQIPEKEVSDLYALVDESGVLISCASSLLALQDNLTFINAKKKFLAKVNLDTKIPPGTVDPEIQKIIDKLIEDTGKPVTFNDIPSPESVPISTSTCDATCQIVTAFYQRNPDPNSPLTASQRADALIQSSAELKVDIASYAKSYDAVLKLVADTKALDNYISTNINANNYNDFIVVQDMWAASATGGDSTNARIIEQALSEGATVTAIAENISSITDKYDNATINAWFDAGYTLTDAYNAGYLP